MLCPLKHLLWGCHSLCLFWPQQRGTAASVRLTVEEMTPVSHFSLHYCFFLTEAAVRWEVAVHMRCMSWSCAWLCAIPFTSVPLPDNTSLTLLSYGFHDCCCQLPESVGPDPCMLPPRWTCRRGGFAHVSSLCPIWERGIFFPCLFFFFLEVKLVCYNLDALSCSKKQI